MTWFYFENWLNPLAFLWVTFCHVVHLVHVASINKIELFKSICVHQCHNCDKCENLFFLLSSTITIIVTSDPHHQSTRGAQPSCSPVFRVLRLLFSCCLRNTRYVQMAHYFSIAVNSSGLMCFFFSVFVFQKALHRKSCRRFAPWLWPRQIKTPAPGRCGSSPSRTFHNMLSPKKYASLWCF